MIQWSVRFLPLATRHTPKVVEFGPIMLRRTLGGRGLVQSVQGSDKSLIRLELIDFSVIDSYVRINHSCLFSGFRSRYAHPGHVKWRKRCGDLFLASGRLFTLF